MDNLNELATAYADAKQNVDALTAVADDAHKVWQDAADTLAKAVEARESAACDLLTAAASCVSESEVTDASEAHAAKAHGRRHAKGN